jgi:hypothetical protein
VFLGYNNLHNGYKCLNTSTCHVYISHDVIFDENVFPFAVLHPTADARYIAEVLLPGSNPFEANTNSNVFNSHTASIDYQQNLWTHQLLQPEKIPDGAQAFGTDLEEDPILSVPAAVPDPAPSSPHAAPAAPP